MAGGGGEGPSRFAVVEENYSSPAAVDAAGKEASTSNSAAGRGSIAEDPILLLELFHKAIKAQLDELGHAVAAAAEDGGSGGGDLVADIRRRFEFLKQVYKYHCAAEDEVIFVALDVHMKNIACSYCLEHKSIDDLFDSISQSLNLLSKSQGIATKELQELVFSVGTLKKAICKHMLKEEEQVFPLLMKQFSGDEQASLVWQVICSVPVMVLVDLFPWLTRFLSIEEDEALKYCIKKVVPKDALLQELVISWLDNTNPKLFGACVQYGKLAQCPGEPENLGYGSELFLSQSFSRINSQCLRKNCLNASAQVSPIGGLHLWHAVIKHDLKEILADLHEMKRSSKFASLDSVIVRIKFLADVLIFYSDVLDKIFHPLLDDLSEASSFLPFFDKDEIEGLQEVLYHGNRTVLPCSTIVQKLLSKMEPFELKITEQLSFQETKVFPLIIDKCKNETQVQLLFLSLHMMPLGLLKCVITWFSSHLPKDKMMYILSSIKDSVFLDESFASLLQEWVRIGYSGKTSVKDLQEMFKTNVSYIGKQTKEDLATSRKLGDVTGNYNSWFGMLEKNAMLYSREINMRVLFPQSSALLHPILDCPPSTNFPDSLDPRPIDHIYYFHKAVKRELEYLVQLSDTLPEKFDLLFEFGRRFHILRLLCQLHREAEDEIAFPALEAKETGQNISQSYKIDHKLETDYFKEISDVLSKMSELQDPLNLQAKEFMQMSLRLQNGCRSLQKILGDHNYREEIKLLPIFRTCFSTEEQEKIVGRILGRTRSEILQDMVLWLMESLNPEEQRAIMSFWRKATKDTMFDEWLTEWWEGTCKHNMIEVVKESESCSMETMEFLEIVWKYLSYQDSDDGEGIDIHEESVMHVDSDSMKFEEKAEETHEEKNCNEVQANKVLHSDKKQNGVKNGCDLVHKSVEAQQMNQKLWQQKGFVILSQQELEAAIRRVSRDSSLDSEKKTRVIQYLFSSRWNMVQQQSISDGTMLCEKGKLQGQFPSYRDKDKSVFGCKHYKQNCKLIAPCCKQIFTCRRCHDDASDHPVDRKSITQMMCMKCLVIQPIGPSCISCKFSMARYYCRICRLFDDDREIYHCPFCNLCRLGKGLGIDFFHCMKCNACMSPSLLVHVCREKCLEDVCPICHEDMFTSSNPVKALQCGHLMHSSCFQEYTRLHYVCPVCSKSLGDMKVYFAMLDAYLAEEKLPDECSGQTQAILCNDCGKKGSSPFHWLHHKCPFCGSYNTRVL